MVDPWESVDLTLTCDSDEEPPLAPDGEPVLNIPRLPGREELRGSTAKLPPSLAQKFSHMDSRKCSNNQERRYDLEGISIQRQSVGPQSTSTRGDKLAECNFRVESTFSIATNHESQGVKRKQLMPAFDFNNGDAEKTKKQLFNYMMYGIRCEEEVIEIDEDSNDQIPSDPPDRVVVSGSENRYCTVQAQNIEDVDSRGGDNWEELDIKYHNGEPPVTSSELNIKSPDLHTTSSAPLPMSPDSRITSQVPHVTSQEPHLVDDLVDAPQFDKMEEPILPQYKSLVDDNETESIISINSDNESENCLVRSPHMYYYCIYCEYSTIVEECYHKHIAGHLPGTKPYLRMYCTECSYSTGSEKFLLFHLTKTHCIRNPEFYRSGEKRYTCRICKLTQELRTDIESHIKDRHKSRKKVVQTSWAVKGKTAMKMRFQCVEDGCALDWEDLRLLRSHVIKRHKITPLCYYEFVPQKGKPFKEAMFRCFSCGFKGFDKNKVRFHAKKHYTREVGPNVEAVTNTVTVDLCEEMDLEEHNQELQSPVAAPKTHLTSPVPHVTSPGPLVTSPKPHVTSLGHHETSPEPHVTSFGPHGNSPGSDSPSSVLHIASSEHPVSHPTSPEPDLVDDEQLVDMPEHYNDSPSPPYSHSGKEEVENDTGSSDSDYNSENRQGQSPRTFCCIYCEYTTVIEEWYHKHIASHLPGTKPYFRMYCTECSYSTGTEKYMLFHMSQTHNILNPEFYRSGEKRYTCRICKHTQELRIDIESHIKKKHKSEKKKVVNVKFQCGKDGCAKRFKKLQYLHSHVQKHHNIRFPLCYYEFSQETGKLKYACFSCNKTVESRKCHASTHYTKKQRRAPYLYYCPLQLADTKCTFSSKKRKEITEHYQSVHSRELNYYKRRECSYACLNCHTETNSLAQMGMHFALHCKKI